MVSCAENRLANSTVNFFVIIRITLTFVMKSFVKQFVASNKIFSKADFKFFEHYWRLIRLETRKINLRVSWKKFFLYKFSTNVKIKQKTTESVKHVFCLYLARNFYFKIFHSRELIHSWDRKAPERARSSKLWLYSSIILAKDEKILPFWPVCKNMKTRLSSGPALSSLFS